MISISVVMPTYNTPVEFLEEAVNSILTQTFRDFEFIIIDDCSTNDSRFYLESLQDERIRLIRNPENLGITKSLNIGFKAATGKYIARMDSDDISLPAHFEKQFAFMERNPDVILCGTNIKNFGVYSGETDFKVTDMDYYRIFTLFINPGPSHPTAFFNREMLLRYHISYDERLKYAQDYGLWVEISRCGRVSILEEVLLLYRTHTVRISDLHREEQVFYHKLTQKKLLEELLGSVSPDELDLHYKYAPDYDMDAPIDDDMEKWFHRLIEANDREGIDYKKKLRYVVYSIIMKRAVYNSFTRGMNYLSKVKMFFQHLPFPIALRAAAGMSARVAAGGCTGKEVNCML